MGMWTRLFGGAKHKEANPVVKRIRRYVPNPTPDQSVAIERVPKLAATLHQGADYIYRRVIQDTLQEFDARFDSKIVPSIDEEKRGQMTECLLHYMIFQAYADLSARIHDPNLAGFMLDAVHYELFGELPGEKESFIAYLKYENKNFEDPSAAPIYKFGFDLAAITGLPDMNLPLILSQQSPLIRELTGRLTQLALTDDPGGEHPGESS
ncbi:MAG TPA: hypothetical protein VFG95_05310 [Nitrospiria bacterium]|nr:hypothetical protein [Nitrospiria bacterium]